MPISGVLYDDRLEMGSLSMIKMESLSSRNGEIHHSRRVTDIILIRNCRGGLGIKIVGGKSSLGTDYGIFVKKILAGGVAEADGRLQEGDQILEVNGESMLAISNDRALSALLSAAEVNHAKLVISRDSLAREEFSRLMTALNGGSLPTKYTDTGSHVGVLSRNASLGSSRGSTPSPTTVGKRSWVMSGGRMSPLALGRHGSPSLSPTNSLDKTPASLQRMYSVDLPTCSAGTTTTTPLGHRLPGTLDTPALNSSLLRLNLHENGSATGYTRYTNGGDMSSSERSPKYKDEHQSMTSSEITVDSGLPTDRQSGNSSPIFDSSGEGHVITIPMTTGIGLCIVGGTNRPEGPHIYIEDIIEGSDAFKDGRLKQGDQLVAVNGESLVGVTHEQAKSLLTRLKLRKDIELVEISFIRNKNGSNFLSSRLHNGNVETPNGSLQTTPRQLSLDLNGVEPSESRTSSNRSSDSEPDYSNTSLFMRDLLATHYNGSTNASVSNPSSELSSSQTSPPSLASPPVIVNPVRQTSDTGMQGFAAQNRVPGGYNMVPGSGIQQPIPAVPQRLAGRFQPTMSSTPMIANGGAVVQLPQPPLPLHSTDTLGNALNQSQSGTFQISPVGLTYQSAFEPSSVPYYLQQDLDALRRVTQQYGTPDQPSLQLSSAVVPGNRTSPHSSAMTTRQSRQARNGRRLSLDPHTRLKVEKLEVALRYLGFQPTDEQQRELRTRLHIDHTGSVSYGDFVGAARQVFDLQLNDPKLSTPAFQFAVHDINAMERQQIQESRLNAVAETAATQSQEDMEHLRRERDEALREVEHLRKILKQKSTECLTAEEELMKARQEAQVLMDESRSLQNRVHLVSQAQQAARSIEQDYEEVVKLLEKELAHYKAKCEQQSQTDPKEIEELHKRLVVLGCQLRKAEVGKRTYEVATEKLIHFAELVHDVLGEGGPGMPQQKGKGESPRRDGSGNPRPPAYLARHAKYSPSSLAKEARDTVKSVKSLLEEEPLPFGWEEAYTSDGVRYYINHVTHQTSWLHPITRVQHLPAIMEGEDTPRENVVKETRT